VHTLIITAVPYREGVTSALCLRVAAEVLLIPIIIAAISDSELHVVICMLCFQIFISAKKVSHIGLIGLSFGVTSLLYSKDSFVLGWTENSLFPVILRYACLSSVAALTS
jgi:hypothetical protein